MGRAAGRGGLRVGDIAPPRLSPALRRLQARPGRSGAGFRQHACCVEPRLQAWQRCLSPRPRPRPPPQVRALEAQLTTMRSQLAEVEDQRTRLRQRQAAARDAGAAAANGAKQVGAPAAGDSA